MCEPYWYERHLTCPYGWSLPGDVTVPNDSGVFEYIAVAYSLVVFAVVGIAFLEFLFFRRGTRQLSFLCFVGFIVVLNEGVVKQILRQPRPGASGELTDDSGMHIGSCSHSCGMPSSHATMSVGFLALLLFDAIFRTVPSAQALGRPLDLETEDACENMKIVDFMVGSPLAPNILMTHHQLLGFLSVWVWILLPVPFMRVVLRDHSILQVSIGASLGAIYAAIWFALMSVASERWRGGLGEYILGGCVFHNYAPSRFVCQANARGGWLIKQDYGSLETTSDFMSCVDT